MWNKYILYENTHCIYQEKETTLNISVLRKTFIKHLNLDQTKSVTQDLRSYRRDQTLMCLGIVVPAESHSLY